MRPLCNLVFFLLFIAFVSGRSSFSEPTPCGLGCLTQVIPMVGCSLTDIPCQCQSKPLSQLSAACMLANCTMHDSLVLEKVNAQSCNLPQENKQTLAIAIYIVILIVTGVLVLLRLVAKSVGNTLALEDTIITIAFLASIVSNTLAIKFSYAGFGKHGYSLEDGDLLVILRYFYVGENIYVAVLGATKISILAFYLRIFQHQIWFRYSVYATICLTVTSTAIISLLTIFQCRPIPYFWDKDLHGVCLNLNALAYANSAMSIIQDLLIIGLPIPVVWNMNMDQKKKFAVGFMFALGGFGCIVSMIRLQSLLVFGNSIDPSWDYVPVVIWTGLELSVAMICSSLPALRTLLLQLFPGAKFSLLSASGSSDQSATLAHRSWRLSRVSTNRSNFIELVHIESGRLDLKWEGEEAHVEDIHNLRRDSRHGS